MNPEDSGEGWCAEAVRVFRDDRTFRRFITTGGLILVSSLSPPFIVTISVAAGNGGLIGLGNFSIASGVAWSNE